MNLNPNAIPTFVIALALYWLGMGLASPVKSNVGRVTLLVFGILLAIPSALFVSYYLHVFDKATWFYQFRAFPCSELSSSGVGLIAGLVQATFQPKTWAEKLFVPLVMGALLFIPFVKAALDPVDYSQLQVRCETEVCLQSTPSTCGPTSAATLLKLFGQNSSEQELAREDFTYRGGTEIWYVARSFRKRGLTADFVIQPPDRIGPPAPAIAGVVLPGGAGHFVAILSGNDVEVRIGDPLKGELVIPRANLHNVYHFTGFFLVIGRRL